MRPGSGLYSYREGYFFIHADCLIFTIQDISIIFKINFRMNRIYFLLLLIFAFSGCGLQEREKQLEKGLAELHQKQQELAIKEQALNERQKQLDSVATLHQDTLEQLYPELPGSWAVKMVCSEATCPGSAIGDTKTEQWEIGIRNNQVTAVAISNNKVIRVYMGTFSEDQLMLEAQYVEAHPELNTRIVIRLKRSKENLMTGRREIIRTDDCHIVYDISLKKQDKPS